MKTKFQVIRWLLSYVKLLRGKMLTAILLGSLSFLVVISIPVIGTLGFLRLLENPNLNLTPYIVAMIVCGLSRGLFRYAEQYLNHEIAFRLLAHVRDHVFGVLRKLAPAKLQNKKSGDLIAIITSDVEALEVFFAHTVSPVGIALIVNSLATVFISLIDWRLGILALAAYLIIGVLIPYLNYRQHQQLGDNYKARFADLNQTVVEQLGAVKEVKQYQLTNEMLSELKTAGKSVNNSQTQMMKQGIRIQNLSEVIILFFSIMMLMFSFSLQLSFHDITLATITMMSTFGPVLALSGLGNGLLTTFASGERIYQLVNEVPATPDILNKQELAFDGAEFSNVNFTYPTSTKATLTDFSLTVPKTGILGIQGPSGVGKSTFLKLLMRFWQADSGDIRLSDLPIDEINTESLRSQQGYMEQETFLFKTSVAENINLSHQTSEAELLTAIEKASLSEWLAELPDGLDTIIGGKGRQVSDGERQRLGLARLFLHDAPLMLLDEPTSNLDYLNEKIILQALTKEQATKAIVLVSHRDTTLTIADKILQFEKINKK